MKSYNGLWKKILTRTNRIIAMREAGRGKNKKNIRHEALRAFRKDAESRVDECRELIIGYRPTPHTPKQIYDGISAKRRTIIVPTVEEEVVHHAVVNVLKDIFLPSMYEHSYASIPGRGIHQAAKTIKRWITEDPKRTRYCLKLDIKKFFETVDLDVLWSRLTKIIRDKEFLTLLDYILFFRGRVGLPLGFVTSQWFANFVLTPLDHKIKEEWAAPYYIRFMDDMVIFAETKKELHILLTKITEFVETTLHQEIKDNWQIFPLEEYRGARHGRFLDFLGFKFYRRHTGLRQKVALKLQRKAQHIHKKDRANIRDARQMVTYGSYMYFVDCHDWFIRRVALYVSIRGLRKKISRYDKCQNLKRTALSAA